MDMRQKVQTVVEAVQYSASFVGMAVGIGAFTPSHARTQQAVASNFTTEQWIGIGSLVVAVVGLLINGWMKRNDNRRADIMTQLAIAENLREEEDRKEKREEHQARMAAAGVKQNRRSLQQPGKD
jgi:hypothetical protein